MAADTRSRARGDQGGRLAPKVWERHRKTILRLYEDHSLAEVMDFMEREHGFVATAMAYKKKLGRWKTTKKHHGEEREVDEAQSDVRTPEASTPIPPQADCLGTFETGTGEVHCSVGNRHDGHSNVESMNRERSSTIEAAAEEHGSLIGNLYERQSAAAAEAQNNANIRMDMARNTSRPPASVDSHTPTPSGPVSTISPSPTVDPLQDEAERKLQIWQIGRLHDQFFGTLFGSGANPPFNEIIGTLASLFDRYANTRDIFQLERIVSLYDFMLTPGNPVRLRQCLRFCRIACKLEKPDENHARLFLSTLTKLTDQETISGPAWELPDDVDAAARFWLARLYDNDTLLNIIAKISKFYSQYRSGLVPAYEPYLFLARLSRTEEDRWDFIIITCLEKVLGAIFDRLKGAPLSGEEDRFVTRTLMFLWTRQQGDKTFYGDLSMFALLRKMVESQHTSANFHGAIISCIAIQGTLRQIDFFAKCEKQLTTSFLGMETMVKSITASDHLQFVQDILCTLSTEIKKRQDWLEKNVPGLGPDLRERISKLSWGVFCAIADGKWPDLDAQNQAASSAGVTSLATSLVWSPRKPGKSREENQPPVHIRNALDPS